MKESHRKAVAIHSDPESRMGSRKPAIEALIRAQAGRVLRCEIIATGVREVARHGQSAAGRLLRSEAGCCAKSGRHDVEGVRETSLDEKLADLHGRIHRGPYRAQPSKGACIPKADGRQRPLSIAALEVGCGLLSLEVRRLRPLVSWISSRVRPGRRAQRQATAKILVRGPRWRRDCC